MGVLLAAALVAAVGGTGCGGPAADPGTTTPQLRTREVSGLSLTRPARPDDRELHLQYAAGALVWTADPIAQAHVDQTPTEIVVRLVINERVPRPDEQVPNYAAIRTTTVQLDRPVGHAAVLDGSAHPPAPMPVRPAG
jgi:hypothetical protein